MSESLVSPIAALPNVEYVEKDVTVKHQTYVSQADALGGFGRTSHVSKGSNTSVYNGTAGAGAGAGNCSCVIDAGMAKSKTGKLVPQTSVG